jgi:predicted glycosyltransferase involved in capsule biosynthesis
LHRIFKGELKTEVIDYEFGNFQKAATDKQSRRLAAFEAKLIQLDKKFRELKEMAKPNEQMFDFTPPKELMNRLKEQFDNAKGMLRELFEK